MDARPGAYPKFDDQVVQLTEMLHQARKDDQARKDASKDASASAL